MAFPAEQCLVQWQGMLWQADGRADGGWFCRLGVCRQPNGAQCRASRGIQGTQHCRCSRTERVKHLSQMNLLDVDHPIGPVDGMAWVGKPVGKNLISYFQFLELFSPPKKVKIHTAPMKEDRDRSTFKSFAAGTSGISLLGRSSVERRYLGKKIGMGAREPTAHTPATACCLSKTAQRCLQTLGMQ